MSSRTVIYCDANKCIYNEHEVSMKFYKLSVNVAFKLGTEFFEYSEELDLQDIHICQDCLEDVMGHYEIFIDSDTNEITSIEPLKGN